MAIELTEVQRVRLIKARGEMTQQELAERLDVSQAYVSQVESGSKQPSGPFVSSWGEAVGIAMTVLPRRVMFSRNGR